MELAGLQLFSSNAVPKTQSPHGSRISHNFKKLRMCPKSLCIRIPCGQDNHSFTHLAGERIDFCFDDVIAGRMFGNGYLSMK